MPIDRLFAPESVRFPFLNSAELIIQIPGQLFAMLCVKIL
jgi:hypothetical protein